MNEEEEEEKNKKRYCKINEFDHVIVLFLNIFHYVLMEVWIIFNSQNKLV